MKKLLLGLGTLMAVAVPVTAVVACGETVGYISTTDSDEIKVKYKADESRKVLTGHLRKHLFETSINYRSRDDVYDDIWSTYKVSAGYISGLSTNNYTTAWINYTLDPKEYGIKLDVDFDYRLTLNRDNISNPFYVLDITNAKLSNENEVIQKLNSRDFSIDTQKDISGHTKFEPGVPIDSLEFFTAKNSDQSTIDAAKELETQYHDQVVDGLKQSLISTFKHEIESTDIYGIANSYLEKYVTNFTDIKDRESNQYVTFDESKII